MRYRAAAIIFLLILLYLIGLVLVDLAPFALGSPIGSTYDPNAWLEIEQAIRGILPFYRVPDLLIQATLILAAVIGASAMFRLSKKEESENA